MSYADPSAAIERIRSAEPYVTAALRAAERWDLADADGLPEERRQDAQEALTAARQAVERLVSAAMVLKGELAEVRRRDGERSEPAVEQQALI